MVYLLIMIFHLIALNFPEICTVVFNSFLKINFSKTILKKSYKDWGAILMKNEVKSIFAAEPIIIFGGSPIKVAAPPILDARVWPKMKGVGAILRINYKDIPILNLYFDYYTYNYKLLLPLECL